MTTTDERIRMIVMNTQARAHRHGYALAMKAAPETVDDARAGMHALDYLITEKARVAHAARDVSIYNQWDNDMEA